MVLLAGGFGASGINGRPTFEAPGSALAKAALESSGGDLDRATSSSDVFQQRLAIAASCRKRTQNSGVGSETCQLQVSKRTINPDKYFRTSVSPNYWLHVTDSKSVLYLCILLHKTRCCFGWSLLQYETVVAICLQ